MGAVVKANSPAVAVVSVVDRQCVNESDVCAGEDAEAGEPLGSSALTQVASQTVAHCNSNGVQYRACPEFLERWLPIVEGQVDFTWHYRAEGGANIVVAPSNSCAPVVLRVPKDPVLPVDLVHNPHSTPQSDTLLRRLRRLVEFRSLIVTRLLGVPSPTGQAAALTSAVPQCRVVCLTPHQRRRLLQDVESCRPAGRRAAAGVNATGLALLVDDCATLPAHLATDSLSDAALVGPVIAVEIKAKQGFLADDDVDLPVCPFCAKQYSKLEERVVEQVSRYCPLDLFSGDGERFHRAVGALLNQPQNNLRVFVDGRCVLSSAVKAASCGGQQARAEVLRLFAPPRSCVTADGNPPTDGMLELALSRLLFTALSCDGFGSSNRPGDVVYYSRVDNVTVAVTGGNSVEGRCVEGVGPDEGSFLSRVLRLQRLTQPGPSTVAMLYHELTSFSSSLVSTCQSDLLKQVFFESDFSHSCWSSMVESVLKEGSDPAAASEHLKSSGKVLSGQASSSEQKILQLQRYCVGATVRDCSVMVTLRRLSEHSKDADGMRGHVITDMWGHLWVVVCRIVDLDPKPISRVVDQCAKRSKARHFFLKHCQQMKH